MRHKHPTHTHILHLVISFTVCVGSWTCAGILLRLHGLESPSTYSNICSEDTHAQTKTNTNVQRLCLRVLPDGVFFQQPLHWDGQLPQEALDDWPTLGKLILHLDLQHVGQQSHKGIFLRGKSTETRPIYIHQGTTLCMDTYLTSLRCYSACM